MTLDDRSRFRFEIVLFFSQEQFLVFFEDPSVSQMLLGGIIRGTGLAEFFFSVLAILR